MNSGRIQRPIICFYPVRIRLTPTGACQEGIYHLPHTPIEVHLRRNNFARDACSGSLKSVFSSMYLSLYI